MSRVVVDRIQVPASTTPGETPPSGLVEGELWVNLADKSIFAGTAAGTAEVVGGGSIPSVIDAGTFV